MTKREHIERAIELTRFETAGDSIHPLKPSDWESLRIAVLALAEVRETLRADIDNERRCDYTDYTRVELMQRLLASIEGND